MRRFENGNVIHLGQIGSLVKSILSAQQISLTIQRLANQLIETHSTFETSVLVGLQPRGIMLADRIVATLKNELPQAKLQYGKLDITFYRDDVRKELHVPTTTDLSFSIEGKKVILIDDVLYTGRTIRAAMDALMDYGRPDTVELAVLIDRRYSRQLPIQAQYVGRSIDSIVSQKVKVLWQEKDGRDEILLLDETDKYSTSQ